MKRGATLLGDRLQRGERIEAFAGERHAGAMSERREIAEHHAEAMIERNGDAQPVLGREPHRFADKESVVENVVVRKRRALRKASGAGCELDVDRRVELQLRGELRDAL